MERTHNQLMDALKKQIGFLETSCQGFDSGNEDEALRIATTLRVLVHDTKNSISLLEQLGLKNTMQFIDSAAPIDPVPTGEMYDGQPTMAISGMPGLFNMSFTSEGAKLVAPLSCAKYSRGPEGFNSWWTYKCIPGHNGDRYSRSWLVRQMANREGGAHVDPEISQSYNELQSTSMGMTVYSNGIRGFINSAGNVSIRQVAWEVLESLKQANIIK